MEIKVENILRQVEEDLNMAKRYQGYMDDTVKRFTLVPFMGKTDDLINNLHYDQHYRDIYLERTAAALQLIGYFDEAKGHTVDFECLDNLVLTMKVMTNMNLSDMESAGKYIGLNKGECKHE